MSTNIIIKGNIFAASINYQQYYNGSCCISRQNILDRQRLKVRSESTNWFAPHPLGPKKGPQPIALNYSTFRLLFIKHLSVAKFIIHTRPNSVRSFRVWTLVAGYFTWWFLSWGFTKLICAEINVNYDDVVGRTTNKGRLVSYCR